MKNIFGDILVDSRLTGDDWREISSKWRVDLNRRIHYLTWLRDEFGECIGCGCLSLTHCTLRNPEDILAKEGAGVIHLERD